MDKILLFIPMYNCKKQIVRVLDQINEKNESYLSGIIIVNNRSTDNGEEVVTDYIKKRKALKDRDDRGCTFNIEPWRVQ